MISKLFVGLFSAATLLPVFCIASPTHAKRSQSSFANSKTSLTLIFQNNLNATDDSNHVGAILLDPMDKEDASAACGTLNESLISKSTLLQDESDFIYSLSYIVYAGRAVKHQLYYIDSGVVSISDNYKTLDFDAAPHASRQFPVLCTQSSNEDQPSSAVASNANEISVMAGGNTYIGFRNQKSFRFLGIPYANQPDRFEYSTIYSKKGQTLNATAYGPACAQPYASGTSEDCLFLNIQTPYIPKFDSTKNLRPVMFWIHGGGFTGGTGADAGSDGGNLASREDIIVVSINYRLTTLGFLAIPNTDVKGNYGIADQVVALQWVIENIVHFGGDPNKITIIGESAGAGSVRTLLGSPPAKGKFQGAIAMSNLGGGVDLRISGDYATTYSSYLTIAQSYATAGQQIFKAVNCTQSTIQDQVACLKQVPAQVIVNLGTVARYVVQDGHYVNTENLDVVNRNGSTAHVNVIFGNTASDGASFSTFPKTPVATELQGIEAALGVSAAYAQAIIDSGLFPYYDTGNITLDSFNVSQRVATDNQFLCIDEATVYAGFKSDAFKSAYYYQMQRTSNGYDPNKLGGPPIQPGYPHGNPNLPYFKLHGADMPWVFGNLDPLRDANDLYSIQLTSAYFAEFVKTGQPNPPESYLRARGYTSTLTAVEETGLWHKVRGKQGPIQLLDYPSRSSPFLEVEQCAWLKYPLTYYLDGGL